MKVSRSTRARACLLKLIIHKINNRMDNLKRMYHMVENSHFGAEIEVAQEFRVQLILISIMIRSHVLPPAYN